MELDKQIDETYQLVQTTFNHLRDYLKTVNEIRGFRPSLFKFYEAWIHRELKIYR